MIPIHFPMTRDGRGWSGMAENGWGWLGNARDGWKWPKIAPYTSQTWSHYLEPDGLYASDLKRGALALRDF